MVCVLGVAAATVVRPSLGDVHLRYAGRRYSEASRSWSSSPPCRMPGWMRHIADFDPLNRAMVAGRSAAAADPDRGDVLSRAGAAARAGDRRGVAVDPDVQVVPTVGVDRPETSGGGLA